MLLNRKIRFVTLRMMLVLFLLYVIAFTCLRFDKMTITRAGPIVFQYFIFSWRKNRNHIYFEFRIWIFTIFLSRAFRASFSCELIHTLSIPLTRLDPSLLALMFFAAHKTSSGLSLYGAYGEDAVDLILRIFRRRKNAHARYRWHTSHRLRCTCSVPPPLSSDAMQCNVMRWNAMLARSTREDSTEVTDIVTMPFSSSTLLLGVNYVANDAALLRDSVTIDKSQSSYAYSLII